MALFLAGNSVAELGRKVEVGDVGGEPDSVRVLRGTQTVQDGAETPMCSASAFQPETRPPDTTAQRLSM